GFRPGTRAWARIRGFLPDFGRVLARAVLGRPFPAEPRGIVIAAHPDFSDRTEVGRGRAFGRRVGRFRRTAGECCREDQQSPAFYHLVAHGRLRASRGRDAWHWTGPRRRKFRGH